MYVLRVDSSIVTTYDPSSNILDIHALKILYNVYILYRYHIILMYKYYYLRAKSYTYTSSIIFIIIISICWP